MLPRPETRSSSVEVEPPFADTDQAGSDGSMAASEVALPSSKPKVGSTVNGGEAFKEGLYQTLSPVP